MKTVMGARWLRLTRLSVVILGLGVVALVTPNVLAGTPKPDYSLSVPSQTVIQPSGTDTAVATFTVTMVPGAGGYADPVSLGVKDLPKGLTAEWAEEPATVSADEPSTSLMVTVAAGTKIGTYTFKVTGENAETGKDSHDVTVTLGVGEPSAGRDSRLPADPESNQTRR